MRIKDINAKQAFVIRLVWRILKVFILWFLACISLFILMELLPGDAATNLSGKDGIQAVEETRKALSLDSPFYVRFAQWMINLFNGDLGSSYITKKPVVEIIAKPLISTVVVSLIVIIGIILITIPLAVYSGYYRNKVTQFISYISLTIASVPEFITSILLISVFSIWLKFFPVLSTTGAGQTIFDKSIVLVLPSLCLWLICSATIFRKVKALIETYSESAFVREARLSGISQFRVLFTHLLPICYSGISQLLVQTVPYLLGGTIVVDVVTSFQGLGYTLKYAIDSRETLIVMAIGSIMIATTAILYSLADAIKSRDDKMENSL